MGPTLKSVYYFIISILRSTLATNYIRYWRFPPLNVGYESYQELAFPTISGRQLLHDPSQRRWACCTLTSLHRRREAVVCVSTVCFQFLIPDLARSCTWSFHHFLAALPLLLMCWDHQQQNVLYAKHRYSSSLVVPNESSTIHLIAHVYSSPPFPSRPHLHFGLRVPVLCSQLNT